MTIRLIAGLGNPGRQYANTRHNVGARWLYALAGRIGVSLQEERKFKGLVGRGCVLGQEFRLLAPTTYVNLSGQAVGAMANFYKIAAAEILVAYDEVAFPVGTTRLKSGGGHNGHNGIKSVIAGLGNSRDFLRLRIGVGHPGDAQHMVAYLTGTPMPAEESERAAQSAELSDEVLALVLRGELQQAMNLLHAPAAPAPAATS